MPDTAFFSFRDFDREVSTVTLNVVDQTAANFAAQNTLHTAFLTAWAGLINAVAASDGITIVRGRSGAVPTDQTSAREVKWLVTYEDSSATLTGGSDNPSFGKLFNTEVPCAETDDPAIFKPNTDELDLTNEDVAAAVTAFEAYARSPNGGVPNVLSIRRVGRAI